MITDMRRVARVAHQCTNPCLSMFEGYQKPVSTVKLHGISFAVSVPFLEAQFMKASLAKVQRRDKSHVCKGGNCFQTA